jgi:UDP-N-acetylmuramate dehydrogenase
MIIEENVPLFPHTTFRIGGPARFFCEVNKEEDVLEALNFAKEKSLPVFVLGGGSNILVSDLGFDGLVMRNMIKGVEVENSLVTVGAGEDWDKFVETSINKNMYGLENLSLIPGTVGAAPVQNIGAYGVEVADYIEKVSAIRISDSNKVIFSKAECNFSYRDSFFKRNTGQYVITSVTFSLKNISEVNISYPDLKKFFSESDVNKITPKYVRDAVISIRRRKLPDVDGGENKYGTAGSFFKNPVITKEHFESLKSKYPGIPSFPTSKEGSIKVPAGWILDHVCGFKGYSHGPVGVYKDQALVIVTERDAKAKDVKDLADSMSKAVKEHTGIDLEPEVQFIGFRK